MAGAELLRQTLRTMRPMRLEAVILHLFTRRDGAYGDRAWMKLVYRTLDVCYHSESF